jgi:NAD+ kinase
MISVGILVNRKKDKNHEYAARLFNVLKNAGVQVFADNETAAVLGIQDVLDYTQIGILFVLGGDGTILRAASSCALNHVKIIGINLGRLGFLTETNIPDIETAVKNVVSGEFYTEQRMMLNVEVLDKDNHILMKAIALNDAVVTKKNPSRLIDIEISVNGQLADEFGGDGVIISTPTGSTGYSLSAGGPIICPALDCMVATPVCAHTLYSRSIIFSADDVVRVQQKCGELGAFLSLDGRECMPLHPDHYVRVTKSQYHTEFIRFRKRYFYSLLRSKFVVWNKGKD